MQECRSINNATMQMRIETFITHAWLNCYVDLKAKKKFKRYFIVEILLSLFLLNNFVNLLAFNQGFINELLLEIYFSLVKLNIFHYSN